MNWDDKGFLISKIRYNENSIIAEFFTLNHGKSTGIIFGATSKKIKGYLQIGNLFHLNCNFKNESKIGSFKAEIIEALTPFYFNDKKRLHCITSAMSMIKLLTAENQKNDKVYNLIYFFFVNLKRNNWIKNYILWELDLLKLLGYDLDLKKIVNKEIKNSQLYYFVKSSNDKKFVPNFLIDYEINVVDAEQLKNGLMLVSSYLEIKVNFM